MNHVAQCLLVQDHDVVYASTGWPPGEQFFLSC